LTQDFPVLSAGPTPRTPLTEWTFGIRGLVERPTSWSWDEFRALPHETVSVDIHCVTKWSKHDTAWTGVSLYTLLATVGVSATARYIMAWSDGGYTTNLPLDAITGGKAWIAFEYDRQPLHPEHGGPARLLVPALYFWKSAKWIRGIDLLEHDESGFWERYGYHNYGDPWKEQRYQGD
jgi:DMSO/TMAO reductase YedYZ molybdopterin-dependent catalytic subunit